MEHLKKLKHNFQVEDLFIFISDEDDVIDLSESDTEIQAPRKTSVKGDPSAKNGSV